MQLLTAGTRPVLDVAFAPDGRALVAACGYDRPRLWELPAAGEPVILGTDRHAAHSLTFSAGAAVVGWLDKYTNTRYEFDRRGGGTRKLHLIPKGGLTEAQVTCGPDARLVIWTRQTPTPPCLRAFTRDAEGEWREAWNVGPDESLYSDSLAMAGSGGERFYTWETPSWNRPGPRRLVCYSSLTGEVVGDCSPAESITRLAAAPDGSAVAGFKESSLFLWAPGGQARKLRTGTRKHPRDLAFHADGRHLLTVHTDGGARVIDAHAGRVAREYAWAVGELTAAAISPDGALAAAGGEGGRVVLWDLGL
jgi:WD40 repeat protein